MNVKEKIYSVLAFRWYREIPFENEFLFDYHHGMDLYEIGKSKYKVKKTNDGFVLQVGSIFFSPHRFSTNPPEVRINIQEFQEKRFLKLEFSMRPFPKLLDMFIYIAFIALIILFSVKMMWNVSGFMFFFLFVRVLITHFCKISDTKAIIADIETLCSNECNK